MLLPLLAAACLGIPLAAASLHQAVERDDIETAAKLLRQGADAKTPNRYGVPPLSVACANGNAAIVDLLLKAGADPNAALPGGETPLMTAARTGRLEVVRALLSAGAAVDARETQRGQTALLWAAAEGHAAVAEALIAAGADFRSPLDSGFTPLFFAAREGSIPVLRVLLKAGVDVNQTLQPKPGVRQPPGAPRAGSTALHIAVANAHYDLAAALLEAGANPNAAENGWTALHVITGVRKPGGGDNNPAPLGSGRMTSIEMVKKLKQHGADLNARMTKRINVGLTRLNTMGATPFLLAARSADAELMRVLAALGADPLIPNADNSTPLIVAAGLGTRSPGEDAGTEAEVMEAIQAALDLGNDINAVDNNGETAMHGAAYKNLPGAVQLLADRGAKPSVWHRPNRFGWTPLRIAEGYRFGNFKPSPETVAVFQRLLKAAGIDVKSEPPPVGNQSDYKRP